jgi:hypothetical protein
MRIRSILPVLLALAAGCATELQPPPTLLEVCRASDDSVCIGWIYAGERTELKLLGADLLEAWEVDLGTTEPPVSIDEFRAWIGPAELEQVRLSPQALRGSQALEGVIPGDLPAEVYPVKIETPAGQQAQQANGFEIRDPIWIRLGLDKPTLPRGDQARLTVTIENRGPVPLRDNQLALSQGGSGSFLLPDPPPAFSLAGQSSVDVDLDLVASGPGQPQLAVTVSAMADGRIPVGNRVPAILQASILEEVQLRLSASIQPPLGPVGSQIVLAVTATNDGGVAARGVRMLPPEVAGAGQIQWDPDPGTNRDIAPGQSYTLRWYGTASAAGTAFVSASVLATEALSLRPIQADLPTPISFVIQ